jgi:hypothetical protein
MVVKGLLSLINAVTIMDPDFASWAEVRAKMRDSFGAGTVQDAVVAQLLPAVDATMRAMTLLGAADFRSAAAAVRAVGNAVTAPPPSPPGSSSTADGNTVSDTCVLLLVQQQWGGPAY